jgi:hypothetical protein
MRAFIETGGDDYDQVEAWHHIKALSTPAKSSNPIDVTTADR